MSSSFWRSGLLACVSLAAISGAAPAWAQQTPDDAVSAGDIVVTAQRRSERQVDVPLSLSVLSQESLTASGITGTQGLTQVTPGLQYAQTGILTQPTIRGIGTTGTNVGDSANVATYVDGVYQASMLGGLFELNNIERIEVLKGPQGTLFGRNATGGAIQIYTREPRAETQVEASAGFGSFNDRWIKAYATGGGEQVSANISAVYRQDDGYVRDIFRNVNAGDKRTMSVIGKVKWQPSSDTKVILAGNYADLIDNSVLAPYFVLNNSRSAFQDPTLPYARTPRTTALNITPYNKVKVGGVSLTAQHDTGAVVVKSVTSYQHVSMRNRTDLDAGPRQIQDIFYRNVNDTHSEELTIASSGSPRLGWVAGLFLFRDDADQPDYVINSAPFLHSNVLTKAIGVFGETNFQVTDQLSLIAGIRYSWEEKKLTSQGLANPTTLAPITNAPVFVINKSWDSFTPRISARYEVSDRVNVYATFSKGFKSGAFNSSTYPSSAAVLAPVEPEKVTAYEAGLKLSRGGINFNAAVYHYDYTNIQVNAFVGSSNAIQSLQNAATAKITGVDGDLSIQVNENLRINASAAYTHARYEAFPGAISLTPNPQVNPVNGTANGNVQANVNASGNRMLRQPDYTFGFGADYIIPIGDAKIQLSGNTYFSGSFYWDSANTVKEPAYNITNLRATWIWPGEKVRVSVIGTNVFNTKYNQAMSLATAGTRATLARPASIAGEVAVKF